LQDKQAFSVETGHLTLAEVQSGWISATTSTARGTEEQTKARDTEERKDKLVPRFSSVSLAVLRSSVLQPFYLFSLPDLPANPEKRPAPA
jgi:hypothetical protein